MTWDDYVIAETAALRTNSGPGPSRLRHLLKENGQEPSVTVAVCFRDPLAIFLLADGTFVDCSDDGFRKIGKGEARSLAMSERVDAALRYQRKLFSPPSGGNL